MKRLSAAVLASTTLAVQPVYAQTAADPGAANPKPNSGFTTCSLSSKTGLCADGTAGPVPIAEGEVPHTFVNPFAIIGAGATSQPALGQLHSVTSSYTTAMLNTSQDILRVIVGAFPLGSELGGASRGTTSAAMFGLEIPAGTYNGSNTNPDSAISAYVIDSNTGAKYKSGAAIYTLGMIGATGSFVEGINASVVNSATPFASGTNYDFAHLTGAEIDVNVYCLAAPSNTICASNPTGNVAGLDIELNATAHATGGMAALRVIGSSPVTGGTTDAWDYAIVSLGGSATHGLLLGPNSAASASVNSQDIQFQALTSTGSGATPGEVYADAAGGMHIQGQATDFIFGSAGFQAPSIVMRGPFYASPTLGSTDVNSQPLVFQALDSSGTLQSTSIFENTLGRLDIHAQSTDNTFGSNGLTSPGFVFSSLPTAQWSLDVSNKGVSVPGGGTLVIPPGSVLVLIRESAAGNVCWFSATVGSTSLAFQHLSNCAAHTASGKISLTYNGSNYIVTNGLDAADTINVTDIRLSASN